ncbi:MAG TPA: glycosyltransferase family 2 protein [Candidatus Acidoferrales bacterium]|nr:glycosyltransferase family 2 protein [Candidatus Acidoferrales bacterium]
MSGIPVTQGQGSEGVIPVVILNWNGEDDTVPCLKSIRASVPAGFVPVVVDNGSSCETLEKLKCECGQIFGRILFLKEAELSAFSDVQRAESRGHLSEDSLVFIENGENLGFAKGNNVGIRFAELVGAEWVMLLNNDTVVAPEAFHELREFVKSYPEFSAITPQIRYYNQKTRIQNCGGDLTYFGSRRYKFANMDASALPESDFSVVTFVTGCALLFKHRVTGGLTEDFFFGEEDYEFSLRMRKRGLEMACVHGAVVYHKVSVSIAKSSRPLGGIMVQYASRLINTRNYYSKARWHATRILAYTYLPVLLARKGIKLRKSLTAIGKVESCLKRNRGVDRSDFQAMIGLQ